MFTVVVAIHIMVSVVLVGSVLLHSGKGASLGSSFGGSTSSQALFGSAGPASLFTKVTAICAAVFMMTSLYITYVSAHKDSSSIMQEIKVPPIIVEDPAFKTKEPTEPEKASDNNAASKADDANANPGFKASPEKTDGKANEAAPKK
jgi:preprotein translocase subunit SecG